MFVPPIPSDAGERPPARTAYKTELRLTFPATHRDSLGMDQQSKGGGRMSKPLVTVFAAMATVSGLDNNASITLTV